MFTKIENETETVTTTETAQTPAPVQVLQQNGETKTKKAKAVKKAKEKATKKAAKKVAKKVVKKASTKAAKKAAAPGSAKSPQAQSGPEMELPFDKMNRVEQKIVRALYSKKGERKPHTIKELMKIVGVKSSSPIRNGLRRPVRGRWIEKFDRGTYRITEAGRKRGIPQGA